MKEGRVVEWLVAEGDEISAGDAIATIESDKADMEMEAFEDGVIARIITQKGEIAQVGSPIALVADSEADIAAVIAAHSGGAASEPAAAAVAAPAAAPAAARPDVAFEEVFMPALSSTMTSGKVVSWEISVGDSIAAGQPMLTVESDKADMEVEHLGADGYLAAIVVDTGGEASVGAPVAFICENEADIPALQAYAANLGSGGVAAAAAPAPVAASAPAAAPAAKAAPASSPPSAASGDRVVASPLAKKLASERGIDLASVTGTGPAGRITVGDVESFMAGGGGAGKAPSAAAANAWTPAPGVIAATPMARVAAKKAKLDLSKLKGTGEFGRVTVDDVKTATGEKKKAFVPATGGKAAVELPSGTVPYTGMQRAVASNMEATLAVPIFRVSRLINMERFEALYQRVKPQGISLSALLTKAVAIAVERHPIMNSAHDPSGGIKYNSDINVANAVALEGGLITPVSKNANLRSLEDLAAEWKELVGKAKTGTLRPDEYNSGTIAITNLGMFGVSDFDAVLPVGTGTILALGGTMDAVVPDSKAIMGLRKTRQMKITATCDHRPIYGSDTAAFLKTLAGIIEDECDSVL
jgi:pyruvate dehydrogenase E2 component (dihydrolipoamide acetyltransferase)